MSALPASVSQRFNPADYKTAPDWFAGRFLSQLNLFVNPIYLLLKNGLNFQSNFNAQYYTITFTAGANAAANTFNFTSTISGNPVEVIKAQCYQTGALSVALAPVDFSWYATAGVVYVTSVSGLTAGTSYTLVLRVC
jgi:hypothetical protein